MYSPLTQKSVKKVFEGKLCVENIIRAIIFEEEFDGGDGFRMWRKDCDAQSCFVI